MLVRLTEAMLKAHQLDLFGGTEAPTQASPVDAALWETRPAFGVAGGPIEHALTDAGRDLASRVASGLPRPAVQALDSMPEQGHVALETEHGSRVNLTEWGRQHGSHGGIDTLTRQGHAELVPNDPSDPHRRTRHYRLTDKGRDARARIREEHDSLLARVKAAHPLPKHSERVTVQAHTRQVHGKPVQVRLHQTTVEKLAPHALAIEPSVVPSTHLHLPLPYPGTPGPGAYGLPGLIEDARRHLARIATHRTTAVAELADAAANQYSLGVEVARERITELDEAHVRFALWLRSAEAATAPPAAPAPPAATEVSVTAETSGFSNKPELRNDRRTGRSWLVFATRPTAEEIEALKKGGWRWSGYRGEWNHPGRYTKPPMEFDRGAPVDYSDERADRLRERAGKHQAAANAADAKVRAIADNIPLGQPILVGHHSERHARRDQDKIHAGMRKLVDEVRETQRLREAAIASERHQARGERPDVIARRVDKLKADLRSMLRREQDFAAERPRWEEIVSNLRQRVTDEEANLEAAGGRPAERDPIAHLKGLKPGDKVRWMVNGATYDVLRVNKKSITVQGHAWSAGGKEHPPQAMNIPADQAALPKPKA